METINPLKKKTWFLTLVLSLLISSVLIIFSFFPSNNPFHRNPSKPQTPKPNPPIFLESKLHLTQPLANPIPRLAHLISGSASNGDTLKRTLKVLYHPLNQYVVHLDLEAPAEERLKLADFVKNDDELEIVVQEYSNRFPDPISA